MIFALFAFTHIPEFLFTSLLMFKVSNWTVFIIYCISYYNFKGFDICTPLSDLNTCVSAYGCIGVCVCGSKVKSGCLFEWMESFQQRLVALQHVQLLYLLTRSWTSVMPVHFRWKYFLWSLSKYSLKIWQSLCHPHFLNLQVTLI